MKECYSQQIDAGISDMQAWKKDDLCVIFPIITDIHSHLVHTDPLICMKRVSIDHLEYWLEVAKRSGADFAADFGDDGFDVPLKKEEEAEELLKKMESFYQPAPLPVIHCVGNHDLHFENMRNGFWGTWLKKMNTDKVDLVTGGDSTYGYFDLPAKGCRIFFLNTSDQSDNTLSPEQLEFMDEHLWELSKKQTAIFLSHICPLTRSYWQKYPPCDTPYKYPEFSNMLHEFVEAGGNIAGVFSGDSHANYFDYEGGVNYFVSQGYGGCSTITEKPQQMTVFHQYCEALKRTDTFNNDEYCCIDLAAVKPLKREVRIFRIGAGGYNWHRGAKF